MNHSATHAGTLSEVLRKPGALTPTGTVHGLYRGIASLPS